MQLPGGAVVGGRGLRDPRPDADPEFGLYLGTWWLRRRRGAGITWPHAWIAWPDFGVPLSTVAARAAITDLHARATRGERVEVACGGGTGRTGTVLACLATLDGLGPDEAVAWTRSRYRPRGRRDAVATTVGARVRLRLISPAASPRGQARRGPVPAAGARSRCPAAAAASRASGG